MIHGAEVNGASSGVAGLLSARSGRCPTPPNVCKTIPTDRHKAYW